MQAMAIDPSTPDYLTTNEVADLLRIRERKVYDMARSGEIPCVRVTGKLLFPRDRIERWLNGEPGNSGIRSSERPTLPNVVAGSHDPLLDWAIRESGSGLATFLDGSLDGLDRVVKGEAIAAGMHVLNGADGSYNCNAVRDRAGDRPLVLIEWAKRQQGLLIAADASDSIRGVDDLKGCRIVRRQDSAGGAILFRHLVETSGLDMQDLSWNEDVSRTEVEAASAVASGRADAAPGLQTMARQFKLGFVPTQMERFDLLVDRHAWFEAPFQRLFAFTRTDGFAAKAMELSGYDLVGQGTVHWNGPAQ